MTNCFNLFLSITTYTGQEDKCGNIVALFGETSVELMKGATAIKTCLSTTASNLRHHMDAWSACNACRTLTRRALPGT